MPDRRSALISASKRSANSQTRPSSAPPPALLGLYSLIILWAEDLLRQGCTDRALRPTPPPGTERPPSPSQMPSPPSGDESRSATLATPPRSTGTYTKYLRTVSSAWQMHSASQRYQRNAQSQAETTRPECFINRWPRRFLRASGAADFDCPCRMVPRLRLGDGGVGGALGVDGWGADRGASPRRLRSGEADGEASEQPGGGVI